MAKYTTANQLHIHKIDIWDEVKVVLYERDGKPMYDTAKAIAAQYDDDGIIVDWIIDTDATGRRSKDGVLYTGDRLRRLKEFDSFILDK